MSFARSAKNDENRRSLATTTPKTTRKPTGRLGPVSSATPTPNARRTIGGGPGGGARGTTAELYEESRRRRRMIYDAYWARQPSPALLQGDFVNVFDQPNPIEAMKKFQKALSDKAGGEKTLSTTMSTPGGGYDPIRRKMNTTMRLVFRDDDEDDVVVRIPKASSDDNDVKVEKIRGGVERMEINEEEEGNSTIVID